MQKHILRGEWELLKHRTLYEVNENIYCQREMKKDALSHQCFVVVVVFNYYLHTLATQTSFCFLRYPYSMHPLHSSFWTSFFLMICRKCSEALSEEPSSSCLRVRRQAWHPEDKYCPGAPCNIPSLDLGWAESFLVHLEAAWIRSSNTDAIRHRHAVRRGKFKVFQMQSLKKT